MHPLKRYLREAREPVQTFAARVGASRQTLYRIFSGAQAPKPALARRIIEATGGAVTFDALYSRRENDAEIVVLKSRKGDADALDADQLAVAIAIVCSHLTPSGEKGPPEAAYPIAAEAVINTHAALSAVTTRRGPDRLRQALRPVIEEILREYLASPPTADTLDRAASLACELYCHTTQRKRGQSTRT